MITVNENIANQLAIHAQHRCSLLVVYLYAYVIVQASSKLPNCRQGFAACNWQQQCVDG